MKKITDSLLVIFNKDIFLNVAKKRFSIILLVFFIIFGVFIIRSIVFSVDGFGEDVAAKYRQSSEPTLVMRSDIVDRNGTVLALSVPSTSVYVNPRLVLDLDEAVLSLHAVFPSISRDELRKRLSNQRQFVWIARNISSEQKEALRQLGIPGIKFFDEFRRYYPYSNYFSHIIGFTDIDNKGISGLERGLNDRLTTDVSPVVLSTDIRLQVILHNTLESAIHEYNAKSAYGVIMGVKGNEILALASIPDFDPNNRSTINENNGFNRAVQGVYEQGSVYKIFNIAAALDSKKVSLYQSYDITGPFLIGEHLINDDTPRVGMYSVPEIIKSSSNIGSAKIARDMGIYTQREYLERFNFLTPLKLEIAEVGTPILPNPWREVNSLSISYGYGLAVSLLQVASGISAVANAGVYRQPTFLKRSPAEYPQETRVISSDVARKVMGMMRLVVVEGTGRNADIPGYDIGGKTSSSRIVVNGGYSATHIRTSFVAVFPVYRPKYVIAITVEEPQGYSLRALNGGAVVAPLVKDIMRQMIAVLGIEKMEDARVYQIRTNEERINYINSMPDLEVQ